ncbi:MAG: putative acid sphingomyelinase-like phosphodiesterase [Acidobacteria bacterium]|nr:putative acid sphingomyelinase-like phosphodiesterase [Acidobacteriota bacterium]
MTGSRRQTKIVTVLLAFVLLMTALPGHAAEAKAPRNTVGPQAATGTAISISDIHFNPFYDPALVDELINADYTKWQGIFAKSKVEGYFVPKQDTNYVLLNSTLANISAQVASPDFIIISGDFLEHDFKKDYAKYFPQNKDANAPNLFITKTIGFVTWMIEQRFPNTPVYPALGNNDSYCGDYNDEPGGKFLSATAQDWQTLLKDPTNVSSFMKNFPLLGSYSVVVPTSKTHRVIVLNSNFFSNKYQNVCGNPSAQPGRDEMKWLEQELQSAEKQQEHVWLLFHIPPGIDVFSSLTSSGVPKPQPVPFWNEAYLQPFMNLMARYSSVIVGSFTGHIHMDSFELVPAQNKQAAVFVHITPAISPVYGNNPAFEVVTYDRQSAALSDYSVYYFDLASAAAKKNDPVTWQQEYTFSKAYVQAAVTPATLQAVHDGLLTKGNSYATNFGRYYNVSRNPPALKKLLPFWCGMIYLTIPEYQNCLKTRR